MRRRAFFLLLLVFFAVLGLGYLSWPFEAPFRTICGVIQQRSGWKISAEGARWTPWRDLTLSEMRVESPAGGRVHLSHVTVSPQAVALFRGRVLFLVKAEDLQMDPGSWGIRNASIKESLSSTAVARTGFADLQLDAERLTLRSLEVNGPLVRFRAHGWMNRARQAHLDVDGTLAREALIRMGFVEAGQGNGAVWEPFRFQMDGLISHPVISFASSFFTLSQNNLQGEHHA